MSISRDNLRVSCSYFKRNKLGLHEIIVEVFLAMGYVADEIPLSIYCQMWKNEKRPSEWLHLFKLVNRKGSTKKYSNDRLFSLISRESKRFPHISYTRLQTEETVFFKKRNPRTNSHNAANNGKD